MPAKKAKAQARTHQRLLLYRVVNRVVVFALADRATLIAGLHDAIERSRTWAEFRKAMPKAEYSEIMRYFDANGEKRPRSTDPLSSRRSRLLRWPVSTLAPGRNGRVGSIRSLGKGRYLRIDVERARLVCS